MGPAPPPPSLPPGSRRRAVFLDRDGTLIEDRDFLADPDGIALVAGATEALRRLRSAGFATVVTTNQSGIARGLISLTAYAAVKGRLDAILEAAGVPLDATYMCPHHPEFSGACTCRKPSPGLYERATRDLGLDLTRSVLVGDRWRDIAAAKTLHARGMLVPSARTPAEDLDRAQREATVVPTLAAAVDIIVAL